MDSDKTPKFAGINLTISLAGKPDGLLQPGCVLQPNHLIQAALPLANVHRTLEGALISAAQVSTEAKESANECTIKHMSFVFSEGRQARAEASTSLIFHRSRECRERRGQNPDGEDILWAMKKIGFDPYAAVPRRTRSRKREVAWRVGRAVPARVAS